VLEIEGAAEHELIILRRGVVTVRVCRLERGVADRHAVDSVVISGVVLVVMG